MFGIRLKEIYIFIPVLVAYSILYLFYPFITIATIIKFLLFQFLFLLLPGYIFSKWLISEKLTKIQSFIFGYPVSMIIIFILSWIGHPLNIEFLEITILPFAVMSIYKMIKDRKDEVKELDIPVAVGILFYSICIIITFRFFILPSAPPTPNNLGLYYQDSLWTIGNSWAYIRGFPLEEARFAGILFGYHMLQNIFQATVFKFTKIDPFYIHFYIEPIFDWFVMVFLVFYGGIKIAKFSLRKIAIFCVLLFFSSSFLGGSFQGSLFTNPLSLFFGLPVFILFLFYIISYVNKQRELDVVYLTTLFVYFTATKPTLGIIILVTLTILLILKMINKKLFFKEILLIFGLFFGAILLKFTIFQNIMTDLYIKYDPTISRAYQLFKQINFIKAHIDIIYPFYRFFSTIFRLLPNYILNYSILLFFTLLFTNIEFRKKFKNIKNSLVFIFIFFLVSIVMGSIFVTSGGQVYYIMYTQAVFLFLGVLASEHILNVKNIKYIIFAFFLLTLSFIIQVKGFNNWVRVGWGGLPNAKRNIWDDRATIDYYEWLAMNWFKENSGPNELFFSDRRHFTHERWGIDVPRFCAYSALNARQAFAEGYSDGITSEKANKIITERWNLINRFLSLENISEQKKLLNGINANYFIQSLRFNKKDFSKIDNLKLIYENKSIKIFKILK